MISNFEIVETASRRISDSANRTLEDFRDELVEQEPAFTDRMLGRIASDMEGFEDNGVKWRGKTLTDRGKDSQESEFGADFMGVLEINISTPLTTREKKTNLSHSAASMSNYKVKKGFLAQAKLLKSGKAISVNDKKLCSQCEKMLAISPDSFVFLYSSNEIRVVPAISVVSATNVAITDLYSRNIASFFQYHFECFVGDRKISAPKVSILTTLSSKSNVQPMLASLCRQFGARSSLFIGAQSI